MVEKLKKNITDVSEINVTSPVTRLIFFRFMKNNFQNDFKPRARKPSALFQYTAMLEQIVPSLLDASFDLKKAKVFLNMSNYIYYKRIIIIDGLIDRFKTTGDDMLHCPDYNYLNKKEDFDALTLVKSYNETKQELSKENVKKNQKLTQKALLAFLQQVIYIFHVMYKDFEARQKCL